MRSRITKAVAMLLAVMIMITSVPTGAKVQAAFSGVVENALAEGEYKEGEAIVMYANGSLSLARTKDSDVFGEGIKVEQTWDFAESDNVPQTADAFLGKAIQKQEKQVKVAKVSSTKYGTKELLGRLNDQANVMYAEPNYIVRATDIEGAGKHFSYQWALDNNGQNSGTPNSDINVEYAWDKVTGTDKVIALVDTGVDYSHEDLKEAMWVNPVMDKLPGKHGYDCANKDDDPMDDVGHGTHCAGIIAGGDNGISGVNKKAKIMALKFLDSTGTGEFANAISCYDYIDKAMDLGVDVVAINNSWGDGRRSDILEKLITIVGQKGAISVAAAGNDGEELKDRKSNVWSFNNDYLIKVAASNEKDELAGFSDYGKKYVDLAAPGCNILSTVSYDCYNPSLHLEDENYSQILKTFETSSDAKAFKALKGISSSAITFETQKGAGFGENGSSALHAKINMEEEYANYYLYLPITLPKSTTNYHVNVMCKATGPSDSNLQMGISKLKDLQNGIHQEGRLANGIGSDTMNYWKELDADTGAKEFKSSDKYVLWFEINASEIGEYDIVLDNLGFSKKDMKPEQFGKYDFYNGTSMAAPYITGATALMREMNPDITTEELRDEVAGCVRRIESMDGKTISGGVFDFAEAGKQRPIIKQVTAKDESLLTIKGNYFGTKKGTVRVGGKKVSVKSWSNNTIVVATNGLFNKEVDITVETKTNGKVDATEYITYNKAPIEHLTTLSGESGTLPEGKVAGTDGESYYIMTMEGVLYRYDRETDEFKELAGITKEALDSSEYPGWYYYQSDLIYDNGVFYVEIQPSHWSDKRLIARYDIKSNTWSKLCDLPDEDLKDCSIAVYHDQLYIMGGWNDRLKEATGAVYTVDLNKKDAAPVLQKETIPNRFHAKAVVVEDKLVLTLGGDGTVLEGWSEPSVKIPNNLIFDGTTWKEDTKTNLYASKYEYEFTEDYDMVPYVKAIVGSYKENIVYSALSTKEYGDIYSYNVNACEYAKMPASFYDILALGNGYNQVGTIVNGMFYIYIGDDWTEMRLNPVNDEYNDVTMVRYDLYSMDASKLF